MSQNFKRLLVITAVFFCTAAYAQPVARPKLVVGLVVDQMRWDFLYRYYDRYSTNGFKRLLGQGFSCENTFIPYLPTYTAPGHACVYTGSVPALNGIIGNNWYDKKLKRSVYCTEDFSVQTVGSASNAGQMSSQNLWTTTITDELRLATNFRNKTIAIALKDRGAILPGGHTANAAYWFDNASGGWISSSFYMQQLPNWVQRFNNQHLPDSFLQQNWRTLYPIETYRQSTADSNAYESKLGTEDISFPHITNNLGNNKYEVFRTTPFGSNYTLAMAKEAIVAEQLGKSGFTDFLAVSLSSPDYIGHAFGPNSVEIEDTYLRLDQALADFLQYLDRTVGQNQYLLFLTADHGAAHNPTFAQHHNIPGGVHEQSSMRTALADSVAKRFGVQNLISTFTNYQVYLNDSLIDANGVDKKRLKQYVIAFLRKEPAVSQVVDLEEAALAPVPAPVKNMIINGYNHRLSGDIQVLYKPQWFENWRLGTTHGLWNDYDAHIPLIWYGWNIKQGKTNRQVFMTDIAPTLGALLKVQMPNAAIGTVIEELTAALPAPAAKK